MAQRVSVLVLCDIDEVESAATIEFAFRGNTYEVDLCEPHQSEMEDALSRFVLSARRTGRARRSPASTRPRTASVPAVAQQPALGGASDKDARTAIRQWAIDNGYEVGMRGRIAEDIVNAYNEANH